MANGNGDVLRQWWPMIAAAFLVAVSWGTMQSQVNTLAEEVTEVKKIEADQQRQDVTERLKVRSLEERQKSIQDDVEEIKQEQKEQGKKLDKILEKLNESD